MMRVFGAFGNPSADMRGAFGQLDDAVRSRPALRLLRFPDQEPILVVAYDAEAYPAIGVHQASDGSIVIVDGEIYNPMPHWRTGMTSGDEVAAAVYRDYLKAGEACFDAYDGAGGIAVFDARTRCLFVARDAIGNGAVFDTTDSGPYFWGSSVADFIPFLNAPKIDRAALDYFLAGGYILAPWTMIQGVRRIPPGHFVSVNANGQQRLHQYWVPSGSRTMALSESEVVSELETLLPKAIGRRINDASRTGILLSGGVDSKTLLAIASKRASSVPRTFTFHYEGYDGPFNEASLAVACAKEFGAEHHKLTVSPEEISNNVSRFLKASGEPFSYGLHSLLMEKVRETGVTDLLGGALADVYFTGSQELNSERFRNLPAIIQGMIRAGASFTKMIDYELKLRGIRGGLPIIGQTAESISNGIWSARTGYPFYVAAHMSPSWERSRLYADASQLGEYRLQKEQLRNEIAQSFTGETQLNRLKYFAARSYGVEMVLNWLHWAGRANGLAIRSPFADRELMDFMMPLVLTRPGKPELRAYAEKHMPHDMAYTPKVPQSIPLHTWFDGPLKPFVNDYLSKKRIDESGIFSSKEVGHMLERQYANDSDSVWPLWNVLIVTKWQEELGISP